ncbi:hypothetical protein [Aquimarina intermedia]|uniref:Uncharacterized protein n=1 Tax=Aquimarina intermedia TaxID=350814 RepID=A0A5S5C735_9FLAO|nr:hypothetical protein [Aquimarina intermedia]TYP74206.1 hypothetical protein BD809_10421 [Aquimarina intermedia]
MNHPLPLDLNQECIEENSPLNNLKPAAAKLLLDGSGVDVLDIIRLTVLDLIFKKVLVIRTEFRKSHSRDNQLRHYTIIETGTNFKKYVPDQFEKYFTEILDDTTFYYLRSYLKKIYTNLPSNYICYRYVIKGSYLEYTHKNSWLIALLQLTIQSKKGTILKRSIKSYLDKTQKRVSNGDISTLHSILNELGSHIFILDRSIYDLFNKVKFKNSNKDYQNTDAHLSYDHIICDDFDNQLNVISQNFDTLEINFSDNSDSDNYDADFD